MLTNPSARLLTTKLLVNQMYVFEYASPELKGFFRCRSDMECYSIPIGINYEEAVSLQNLNHEAVLVLETDLISGASVIGNLYEQQDPCHTINYEHHLLFR